MREFQLAIPAADKYVGKTMTDDRIDLYFTPRQKLEPLWARRIRTETTSRRVRHTTVRMTNDRFTKFL